jgi:hypothetical protein
MWHVASAHAGRFINQRCVSTNWKKEERLNITTYPIMLMSLHFHAIMDMIIISRILQEIKGRTSTRYRQWILDNASERFNDFCVISKSKKTFRLWRWIRQKFLECQGNTLCN